MIYGSFMTTFRSEIIFPEEAKEPIVILNKHYPIRVGMIDKPYVPLLDPTWNKAGIYFLISNVSTLESPFKIYIGQASQSHLPKRIREHNNRKDKWQWDRAIMVHHASSFTEWDSGQINWLEGAFYQKYYSSIPESLVNKAKPGDNNISAYDKSQLETTVVNPVCRMLRIMNLSPETRDNTMVTKVTWFSEVYEILLQSKKPLSRQEILDSIIQRAKLEFSGKTPEQTLSRVLGEPMRAAKAKGADPKQAVFVRTGSGVYQIHPSLRKG